MSLRKLLFALLMLRVAVGIAMPSITPNILYQLMHAQLVATIPKADIGDVQQQPVEQRQLTFLYRPSECAIDTALRYLTGYSQGADASSVLFLLVSGETICPRQAFEWKGPPSCYHSCSVSAADAASTEAWLRRGLAVAKGRDTTAMWHWLLDGLTHPAPAVRMEVLYALDAAGHPSTDPRIAPVAHVRWFPQSRAAEMRPHLDTLWHPINVFIGSEDYTGMFTLAQKVHMPGWQDVFLAQSQRRYAFGEPLFGEYQPHLFPKAEVWFAQNLACHVLADSTSTPAHKQQAAPLVVRGYRMYVNFPAPFAIEHVSDRRVALALVKYTQDPALRAAAKALFDHPQAGNQYDYDRVENTIPTAKLLALQKTYYEAACRAVGVALE